MELCAGLARLAHSALTACRLCAFQLFITVIVVTGSMSLEQVTEDLTLVGSIEYVFFS